MYRGQADRDAWQRRELLRAWAMQDAIEARRLARRAGVRAERARQERMDWWAQVAGAIFCWLTAAAAGVLLAVFLNRA